MREYVPDNFDRYTLSESEEERIKRLRERFEWELEHESDKEEE